MNEYPITPTSRRFGISVTPGVLRRAVLPLLLSAGLANAAPRTPVVQAPPDGGSVAIRSWLVAGPIPSAEIHDAPESGPRRRGYSTDFLRAIGGERAARVRPGTDIRLPGETVRFTEHAWPTPYVDLNDLFGKPVNTVAYLYAEIESSRDRDIYFHVGDNDASKIWIDGDLLIARTADGKAIRSEHVAKTRLPRGRSSILVKLDNAGGGWGAYVELYGPRAHADHVVRNFPRRFQVRVSRDMPMPGETISLRIGNWPDCPDLDVPVTWEAVDGETIVPIAGTTPAATFAIPPGEPRVIRFRARATHPDGSMISGEHVALAGGRVAVERAVGSFESFRRTIADPLALTGYRRDAYALALYAVEKLRRDEPTPGVDSVTSYQVANAIGMLTGAMEAYLTGADPYAGMTGQFEAAYLSDADGTAQPITIAMPYSYSPERKYALLLDLHGAGGTHERGGVNEENPSWWFYRADSAYEESTIGASIMGRGRWSSYHGLGEDDMVQVHRWITARWPVDRDRVYIRGGSMGGGGTWYLAAAYPGLFAGAVADCGWAPIDILENLANVPMYIDHGDVDWVVPVGASRLGVREMRRLGDPVVYAELPQHGHDVGPTTFREGYMTKLAAHVRDCEPAHVRIRASHPRHGDQYWARIARWTDPRRPAELDARVLPGNVVSVTLENVERAVLAPPAKHLAGNVPITWMAAGRRVVTPRSGDGRYDVVVSDSAVAVRAHVEEPEPAMRPYAPGALMELYRGEPLLIVRGTIAADESVRVAITRMAETASRWLGPLNVMAFGRVPVKPDTAVTDADLARYNVFCIGGAGENALAARVLAKMPIRESSGALRLLDSQTVPLAGCGYAFLYPNPEHPRRLAYIYGSSEARYYRTSGDYWSGSPSIALGHPANNDPNTPDLVIERIGEGDLRTIIRALAFTHGWVSAPASGEVATNIPPTQGDLAGMNGGVMRETAAADFAFVSRLTPGKPLVFGSAGTRSWDEVRLILGANAVPMVLTTEMTGAEILDLSRTTGFTPAGDDSLVWWRFDPDPTAAAIDPSRTYRVAGSMDMVWSLGRVRGYNPRDLRRISDEAVVEAAMRRAFGVRKETGVATR